MALETLFGTRTGQSAVTALLPFTAVQSTVGPEEAAQASVLNEGPGTGVSHQGSSEGQVAARHPCLIPWE